MLCLDAALHTTIQSIFFHLGSWFFAPVALSARVRQTTKQCLQQFAQSRGRQGEWVTTRPCRRHVDDHLQRKRRDDTVVSREGKERSIFLGAEVVSMRSAHKIKADSTLTNQLLPYSVEAQHNNFPKLVCRLAWTTKREDIEPRRSKCSRQPPNPSPATSLSKLADFPCGESIGGRGDNTSTNAKKENRVDGQGTQQAPFVHCQATYALFLLCCAVALLPNPLYRPPLL